MYAFPHEPIEEQTHTFPCERFLTGQEVIVLIVEDYIYHKHKYTIMLIILHDFPFSAVNKLK